MKILDQVTSTTHTILVGIKNVVEYTAKFFAYVVSLGHTEFPRFKGGKNATIDHAAMPIGERTVAMDPRAKEAHDFLIYLDELEQGKGAAFQRAEEYREYLKDTNPFSSINAFYQKYNAKSFLESLEELNRRDFVESPEYKNYLENNPKNPFSETIQEVHKKYLEAIPERLHERMTEFDAKLYDLFQNYEIMGEGLVKNSFIKSQEYFKLLNKMKIDITYELTIDNVRKAYTDFKKNIPEENKEFLDNLIDKDIFMNSLEYKNLIQKPLFLKQEIEKAHNQFTARIHKEKEMAQFMENLQADSKKFDKLSKSKEYRDVIINPFHSLRELKDAVDRFEKRNFIEKLSEADRKGFIESEEYNNIVNNPFSTMNEFEIAYSVWQAKKQESLRLEGHNYLAELKTELRKETGDDSYYDKFTRSEEYYTNSLTREGMKAAFDEFKEKNPRTWGQYFFGG